MKRLPKSAGSVGLYCLSRLSHIGSIGRTSLPLLLQSCLHWTLGKQVFQLLSLFGTLWQWFFSWTSLLSESLDALMAGEIREKDMKPFWNTLLRVKSTGRTPFKIYRTPMKSGFFNFLRRPIAVGLESLFWYHRKVWRRAGKFRHTLSTDLSRDSYLVLQAFCTFVVSFSLLFSDMLSSSFTLGEICT